MTAKARIKAIDRFVKGLKEDALWSDIGSSAILTAWSNVAGAITPLRGNAHTSGNLTDIDRGGLGIKGNGSDGYIDTNYPNNTDDQDDRHCAVWISEVATGSGDVYLGTVATNPTYIQRGTPTNTNFTISGGTIRTRLTDTGLAAVNRRNGNEIETYISGSSETQPSTSGPPGAQDLFVLDRTIGSLASNGRVAFYSIGSATDPSLLDARVSTLIADLRAIEEAGFDKDAIVYLRAVEEADGAFLETSVKIAINNLVSGLKSDSLWDAIGASCLLCGPRTLAGALVPLRGDAPTAYGFVDGDYDREGLAGDGTSYLDSGRAGDDDPQNDRHRAMYVTVTPSLTPKAYMGHANGPDQFDDIYHASNGFSYIRSLTSGPAYNGANETGFIGYSRASSATVDFEVFSSSATDWPHSSVTPLASNALVFGSNEPGGPGRFTDATIAFYSIGTSLDLAKLDSHVSAYVTAIGAAL